MRKIRNVVIVALILVVAIINFDLAFRIYQYLSMICFIPLVIAVMKLADK